MTSGSITCILFPFPGALDSRTRFSVKSAQNAKLRKT